jgi:hypothetical protein
MTGLLALRIEVCNAVAGNGRLKHNSSSVVKFTQNVATAPATGRKG